MLTKLRDIYDKYISLDIDHLEDEEEKSHEVWFMEVLVQSPSTFPCGSGGDGVDNAPRWVQLEDTPFRGTLKEAKASLIKEARAWQKCGFVGIDVVDPSNPDTVVVGVPVRFALGFRISRNEEKENDFTP